MLTIREKLTYLTYLNTHSNRQDEPFQKYETQLYQKFLKYQVATHRDYVHVLNLILYNLRTQVVQLHQTNSMFKL